LEKSTLEHLAMLVILGSLVLTVMCGLLMTDTGRLSFLRASLDYIVAVGYLGFGLKFGQSLMDYLPTPNTASPLLNHLLEWGGLGFFCLGALALGLVANIALSVLKARTRKNF
jgi:hypothetical protein